MHVDLRGTLHSLLVIVMYALHNRGTIVVHTFAVSSLGLMAMVGLVAQDDFRYTPIDTAAKGALSGKSHDDDMTEAEQAGPVLGVLQLEKEESVVPGQGFLHVLIGDSSDEGSPVAFFYSNASLSPAQVCVAYFVVVVLTWCFVCMCFVCASSAYCSHQAPPISRTN